MQSVTIFRQVAVSEAWRLPPGFYLNVEDAALFLGTSDETIRRYIVKGEITAEKQKGHAGLAGWRWIIPTAEVNRLRRLEMFPPR